MSNLTNPDSLNTITSLEPIRREPLVQDTAGQESQLQPQRRSNAPHPYQSPESSSSTLKDSSKASLGRYPGRTMTIFIAILSLTAFSLATYLTIPWFTESKVVGCNGSIFSCDNVLNSRYSNWLGLPVSGMAALTYASLLVALVLAQSGTPARRDFMWSIVALCCLSAGGAALWFIFLQVAVLKHLCQYCLMAHACGLVLALTFLLARPLGSKVNTSMGILALVGLVFLSVGQTLGKEAPTYTIEEHDVAPKGKDAVAPTGFEDRKDAPEFEDIFEAPDFGSYTPRRQIHAHRAPVSLVSLFVPLTSTTMLVSCQSPSPQQDSQTSKEKEQEKEQDKSADPKPEGTRAEEPQQESGNSGPTEAAPPAVQQESRRILEISGGLVKLDVKQWPAVGNTDAEYVFVEMFDYNCQHCRQTHAAVKAAKARFGQNLAVIVLPMPLNTDCNKEIQQTSPQFIESCLLAKLAVAVWKTNPEKFCEFHDWMFEGANPPNYATALTQAESMVDKTELAKILNSPLPDAYIQKHVQIYARIGHGNIPKLMFKTTSIVGMFQSAEHLVDILNRQGPLVPTLVEKK